VEPAPSLKAAPKPAPAFTKGSREKPAPA